MRWRFRAQVKRQRAAWALFAPGSVCTCAADGTAAATSAGRPQKKGVLQKMRTVLSALQDKQNRLEPS